QLTVYPNPSTTNVIVSYEINNAGNASFYLYDLTGKIVSSINQKYNTGTNRTYVETKSLASGTYILNIVLTSQNGEQYFESKKISIN
ncbi:T9SS type A sorting domain-containing protein, partial [Streptomyces galilaeus]|uniref:T9SS type A sorting domain-containing protein n=1 Tax=Streptomyces galilaeus TaxID=33899 RepID=UPI0038F6BF42